MKLLSGGANQALARAVARELAVELVDARVARFPDGEAEVVVDPDLRGQTAYLVQPTCPPVDAHLVELLMLADAVRRCGTETVVAVVPYLGYARQDRRTEPGQPVGIRVVGDVLHAAGIDRLVVVDPHTRDLEAIFSVAVEPATAVPLLAEALRGGLPDDAVVVAPDLGAIKLAQRYAALLDLPVALVRKTRLSGDEVRADHVVGDVAGRHPIVIDDMISTGGTIAAAVAVLREAGSTSDVTIAATHGVLTPEASKTLGELPIRRLLVTDTIPAPEDSDLELDVVSVAPLLADAIRRLEADRRLDDLEAFH